MLRVPMPSTSRTRRASALVAGWLIVFASCPSSAIAQVSASLSGVVTDATGAPVAGVAVKATQVDTHTTRSVSTDLEGRYQLPGLSVGA
jgi:Carboxypeptidase regulatory-like domain